MTVPSTTFGVSSRAFAPGLNLASQSGSSLLDPVTARELNVSPVPTDALLEFPSWRQRLAFRVKTLFVLLPQTLWKGLRGDSDVTTADFALMAKAPYALTGATMVGAMALRHHKPAAAGRILAGVGMYYLGVIASNRLVNGLYRQKFGIDLGLMFRTAGGGVDRVFRNTDSPRFDLLTPEHYRRMRQKMRIPSNLASPDAACREQALRAVNAAESLKLVWSLMFALAGVSYVAHSDEWGALLKNRRTPVEILDKVKAGKAWPRLKEIVSRAFHDPELSRPRPLGRLSAWGVPLILAWGLYETMRVLTPKVYEATPVQFQPWQRTDAVLPTVNASTPVLSRPSPFQQFSQSQYGSH